MVLASLNANCAMCGSFDNPSFASPSHSAAVNRAIAERVSQLCFGFQDRSAMSLIRRT